MTNKTHEIEALKQLEGLTKTATRAMMCIKFKEWIEEPGGIDRLHDWFMQYPSWYNIDHAIKPTEENRYDRTTETSPD